MKTAIRCETEERTALPSIKAQQQQKAFIACVERSLRGALGVMSYRTERLRQAGESLESRHTLDARGRLAQRLLELAETHSQAVPDLGLRDLPGQR